MTRKEYIRRIRALTVSIYHIENPKGNWKGRKLGTALANTPRRGFQLPYGTSYQECWDNLGEVRRMYNLTDKGVRK